MGRSLWIAMLGILVGCSSVQPYPIDWAPAVAGGDRRCPDMHGTYRNLGSNSGETTRQCNRHKGMGPRFPEGTCDSLAYNLLGSVGEGWGHRDIPLDSFVGAVTIIEQPSDDRLEVVTDMALDEHGTKRATLLASKGDFSCSADRLTLGTRMGVTSIESIDTERRTFQLAADGSLVMQLHNATQGLLYVVPFMFSGDSWVRWQRIPEATVGQETAKP